jgi:hypothetical protein
MEWWIDSATSLFLGMLFGMGAQSSLRRGCDCGHPQPKKGGVVLPNDGGGMDAAELGEQPRDICGCCLEKSECNASDE